VRLATLGLKGRRALAPGAALQSRCDSDETLNPTSHRTECNSSEPAGQATETACIIADLEFRQPRPELRLARDSN
jgi:hypothetical protein